MAGSQGEGKRDPRRNGARRGAAFAGAWHKIARRPGRDSEPAWTRAMTILLLVGLGLVAAAHLLDAPATAYVRQSHSPLITFMTYITDIGLSGWYLVPAGLLFLAVALLDWEARDRLGRSRLAYLFGQAGYAFFAVAVSGLLGNVIKVLVGRGRPEFFDEHGTLYFRPLEAAHDFSSFPSGHSTTVGAVAMVLMLWFPRWRVPIALLALFAAATRIAARAHYPSDIAAGLLVGGLYGLYLARWLAARGAVFRIRPGVLMPTPRLRLLAAVPRSS